jgi:CubicO group peptidase (beta-lactamase class C family)
VCTTDIEYSGVIFMFNPKNVIKVEEVGLSSERLFKVKQTMQRYVEHKEIPGAVTLVAKNDKVCHFTASGHMDIENKIDMRENSLFRMYSMTKPVTAVAILMLYENKLLNLKDPVSKFIPVFKDTSVIVETPPKGKAMSRAQEFGVSVAFLLKKLS